MTKVFAAAVAVLSLCGCATTPTTPIADAPTCNAQADCAVKWAAARTFVIEHAGMKIQTYSDDFLQTFNPTDSTTNLGALVNKEPITGGGYRISAKFWCDNFISCFPNARDTLDQFNRAVAAAAAPQQ